MNRETKAWYKKAQAKAQEAYNEAEAHEWTDEAHQGYLLKMTEIAEYYILACDFDLPGFKCGEIE